MRQRSKSNTRRALQIAVGIGGLVPIGAGLSGILMGPSMIGDASLLGIPFDSHFRYLSGLLFGIGIGFWSTIPAIEKHRERFCLLTTIVFLGGLSRLGSLFIVGVPDGPMLFGLVMELVITPLLAVWQYRVSHS